MTKILKKKKEKKKIDCKISLLPYKIVGYKYLYW